MKNQKHLSSLYRTLTGKTTHHEHTTGQPGAGYQVSRVRAINTYGYEDRS